VNNLDPAQTGSVDAPADVRTPAAPAAPVDAAGGAPGSDGAPAGSALTVPDDHLFEIKYGKETLKVPFAELKSGYQRHKDYTQKTMTLAEERRQYQEAAQRWDAEKQQLRTYLSNRDNVRKILEHLERTGQAPAGTAAAHAAGAAGGEDEFLTAAQARQMLEQERRQYAQMTEARLAKEREEFALSQTAASYSVEIDTTIKGLLDSHPELQAVDDIESLLRQDASKLQPQTLDEAKQYIAQAAQARAAKIQAWHSERAKQVAVNQQKLQNGIEPPSSTPGVMPQGPAPAKLKLGDPRLRAEALAELNSMLNQG
jgi:hypothetical protein